MCGKLSSSSRETAMTRRSSLARGGRQVGERSVLGVERERDEPREAARLVLQLAQAQQVVHAVLDRLDVAVEHRGVGADALAVALARDLEPRSPEILFLQITSRTRLSKISAPPPGQESIPASRSSRIVSGMVLPPTRAIQSISTIVKAFRCTAGKPLLQRPQQPRVVLEGPGRMEPAHDVELGDRLAVAACPPPRRTPRSPSRSRPAR